LHTLQKDGGLRGDVGEVVELVRYAYEDGTDVRSEHEVRKLVCQFSVYHGHALANDSRFMDLLAEGGQFVKDFFKLKLETQI
jgi:hypothetical protein